jgi:hypothetical protein
MSDKKVSSSSQSRFVNIVRQYQRLVNAAKTYYCKFIHVIHARDFLAEFLGTFVLVVRMWLWCTCTLLGAYSIMYSTTWREKKISSSLITLDHTFQLSLYSKNLTRKSHVQVGFLVRADLLCHSKN